MRKFFLKVLLCGDKSVKENPARIRIRIRIRTKTNCSNAKAIGNCD